MLRTTSALRAWLGPDPGDPGLQSALPSGALPGPLLPRPSHPPRVSCTCLHLPPGWGPKGPVGGKLGRPQGTLARFLSPRRPAQRPGSEGRTAGGLPTGWVGVATAREQAEWGPWPPRRTLLEDNVGCGEMSHWGQRRLPFILCWTFRRLPHPTVQPASLKPGF